MFESPCKLITKELLLLIHDRGIHSYILYLSVLQVSGIPYYKVLFQASAAAVF